MMSDSTNGFGKTHKGIKGRNSFFEKLFRYCDGLVELRALPSKKQAFFRTEDFAGLNSFCKQNAKEHLYFGVATRDGSGGRKGNIVHIPAVWCDVDFKDISEQALAENLARFAFSPSLTVESGGGYHIYWLLKEPASLDNLAQVEDVNRRITAYLGGDFNACDAARVLRVPGTINHKYPAKCELAQIKESYQELEDFLDILPEAPKKQTKQVAGEPSSSWLTEAMKGVKKGDRNTTGTRIAGYWINKVPSADVLAILRSWNQNNRPPLPERDLETICRSVARYESDKSQKGADEAAVRRLAKLSPLAYDQVRKREADRLDVRVSVLDQEVKKRRPKGEDDNGRKVITENLEPWEIPVSGEEILGEIRSLLKKHVIMDAHAATACASWCILTYCFDAFRVLPLLAITSPEKRCGKTTLLEVLQGMVKNPIPASNITPAVLFRVMEAYRPCLLIDEADTFVKDNDELRGIINSGHTKPSAFVIRVNPETLEPERFSTWGPKAISMIGQLSDTNRDRAIHIRLKRKTTYEKVARLSIDFGRDQEGLRRKCIRWAADNFDRLKAMEVDVPDVGNDRAQDNWMPLIAIAELAGGEWPEAVHKAMLAIETKSDNDTIRQALLKDIKAILDEQERISSKALVEGLVELEDKPWCDWRHGKPITQTGLARLLKPFGILSKTIRFDDTTAKGYEKEQFHDAFDRYLPASPPFQSVTTSQVNTDAGLRAIPKRNINLNVTDGKTRKVNTGAGCDVVTVENRGAGGKGVFQEQMNLIEGAL